MAISDLRASVLTIINEVERKLALNISATLTATPFTQVLLRLLNDVVANVADAGDWKELYAETEVTAVSSAKTYSINPGQLVHHILEVSFDTQIAPLELLSTPDLRQLNRLNSYGVPRQYCLISVDAFANPQIRVSPIPGPAQDGKLFNIAYYYKPRLYTTSDAATIPPFPADLLIIGLHAYALLEESGGVASNQYATTSQQYEFMKNEALNRYTADTGRSIRITPRRY